ncbi:MAG: methylated-DNA--protein-cysteine methyltransferase [marine bacterium B5-7]|nr:MAG: methylated-DNA--protein-cysteine methyltransferase [marine bacterium B5-7]
MLDFTISHAVRSKRNSGFFDLYFTYFVSPVGALLLAGDESALHYLSFPSGHKAFGPRSEWHRADAPFVEVKRQLDAYFSGDLRNFDLRLHLSGTAFQTSVWQRLAEIPFGETRSYGQIAKELSSPKASRAVGAANGNNPIPVILPCHRVIGANGSLTGFGGGVPTKAFLLRHEAAKTNPQPAQLSLI